MISHLVIVKHAWQSIKNQLEAKSPEGSLDLMGFVFMCVYVSVRYARFKHKWHACKTTLGFKTHSVHSAKCLLLHISNSEEITSSIKIVSRELKLALIFNLHRSYYKYISVSIKAVSLLTTYKKSNSIITFAMRMVALLSRFKGHWQLA